MRIFCSYKIYSLDILIHQQRQEQRQQQPDLQPYYPPRRAPTLASPDVIPVAPSPETDPPSAPLPSDAAPPNIAEPTPAFNALFFVSLSFDITLFTCFN